MIWLAFIVGLVIGFGVALLMTMGSYETGYEDAERDWRYTQQLRDEGLIE